MPYFYIRTDFWFSPRLLLLTGLFVSLTTLPLLAQTIRYVKPTVSGSGNGSSWANASDGLQSIINASAPGDQVWVAAGTYKPTSTTARTVSFYMRSGVAIYGGFAGTETTLSQRPAINATTPSSTTLSGEIGNPSSTTDNSYHVINNTAGLTNSAILDGFLITAGYADGSGLINYGGGMLNNGEGSGNMCSPLIRQCVFVANRATFGGAIYNNGRSSGTSSPVLTNCAFQNNRSADRSGAMYNDGDGGTSSPRLTNCSFLNNTTGGFGGAIFNYGVLSGTSSPVLTNCSFQGNYAGLFGGAMYNDGTGGTCNPIMTNCVLWSNENGGGRNPFYNTSATITITYSLFEAQATGYTSGPGNLTAITSPFVSTTSTQLVAGSAAINTGDPTTTPATGTPAAVGFTDLAGNSPFFGGGYRHGGL